MVHDAALLAFYDGCTAEKKLTTDWHYQPSDIAVVFGVYKSKVPISYPRGLVIAEQRRRGLDVIVLETGYINRGDGEQHHYAAGYNGLNGRADFRNANSPSDRAEKLSVTLQPWRKNGGHILLCGQVPWDASVDHISFKAWLSTTRETLAQTTKRPVRFRPHPQIAKPDMSLEEDLEDCWAVVTFNSNTAVDAAIRGVPVFADDAGSMAYPIANKDISQIDAPHTPERNQWLNDLAFAQWTPEEMRQGLAWAHLSRSSVRASTETSSSTSLNALKQAG
jgi:hypothetical protein